MPFSVIHQPVLVTQVLQGLSIQSAGFYVDATFGQGGHSRAILAALGRRGKVLAFDRDGQAEKIARILEAEDNRFHFERVAFSCLSAQVSMRGWQGKVNGILFDLGVSSGQLVCPDRGFSFNLEGPLDMRMDPTQGMPVSEWLRFAKEEELTFVFKEYGEERYARRIARAIVACRKHSPIQTTRDLVAVISKAKPFHERNKHPATRCFQALRIFINQEGEELTAGLNQSLEVLAPGGRLVVVSFHSLEDRCVKTFIREHSKKAVGELDALGKFRPSEEEVLHNRRARSALMRVAEKRA
ncbi:MAG: 16S rRNA (cytosine(1402)-N(4))-methyltransferase RsmH [Gammaproteobacteria bacterium]|nr:16S rRNA (cytosine(1402)-N(4))-methyltransferase RsmH [Gammaproteobacteria bacterium]